MLGSSREYISKFSFRDSFPNHVKNSSSDRLVTKSSNKLMYQIKFKTKFVKKVKNIEVQFKSNYCYKDIPVKIQHLNKSINAFITPAGIIRDTSKVIECDDTPLYITVKTNYSNDIIIYKMNKNYHVVNVSDVKFKSLNYLNSHFHEKLDHAKVLIEGFDMLKQIETLEKVSEPFGEWFVTANREIKKQNSGVNEIIHNVANGIGEFLSKILWACGTIIVIIVITIIIGCVISIKRKKRFCFSFRDNKPKHAKRTRFNSKDENITFENEEEINFEIMAPKNEQNIIEMSKLGRIDSVKEAAIRLSKI